MVETSFAALFFAIPIAAPEVFEALDRQYWLTFEKRAEIAAAAPTIWMLEYTVVPGLEMFACMDGDCVRLKTFPDELVEALRSPEKKSRLAAEKYLKVLSVLTRSAAWHRERDEGEDAFRFALGKHAQPIRMALEANVKTAPQGEGFFAAAALLALDPEHPRSLDIIEKELSATSAERRLDACTTVGYERFSHQLLIQALSTAITDPDKEVRTAAATALRDIGPKARTAVPALIELFKSGEKAYGDVYPSFAIAWPLRKNLALTALGQIGSEAKSVVPMIVSMFPLKNEETRLAMLVCLGELGLSAREAVPELNWQLAAVSGKPLYHAAAALLCIDPGHDRATTVILTGLNSRDDKTRGQAFEACRVLAPKVKALVPALAAGLKSSDEQIQGDALLAISAMGPTAEAAIPALVELLGRGRKVAFQYRQAAANALGSIGTASYPALLRVSLKVNFGALSKLTQRMEMELKAGKGGPDAEILEKFDRIMNAAAVQPYAVLAFGRLGKDGENAVPLLMGALAADHVAFNAAMALGQLKRVAAPAREALIRASRQHKLCEVRISAAWALTQLDR